MRRVAVLAGLLTILSSVAWSDVTFHLYANGTTNTSLSVAPGGTAALAVLMNADDGEQVVGVSYEVQLPMEGWTLTSREYGDYGWYEDDSNEPPYDGCVPHASGTPVVILNGTYTGGDPDTADFWFNTARVGLSGVTGWQTCEVFEIEVPHGTTPANYSIDLANTSAYDAIGTPFDTSGQFFEFTVTPEPTSALLVLTGVALLGAVRRRRQV